MLTYRCRLFVVDASLSTDERPKESAQFSVTASNCDLAIKAARKHVLDRGKHLRSANMTHNRKEIAVYVFKDAPSDRLKPMSVRESDLASGASR